MSAAIPNDLIAKPAKAQSSVIPPSNSLTAERARDESKKIVSLGRPIGCDGGTVPDFRASAVTLRKSPLLDISLGSLSELSYPLRVVRNLGVLADEDWQTLDLERARQEVIANPSYRP